VATISSTPSVSSPFSVSGFHPARLSLTPPAPPMPTPATDAELAQLLAAVLAYRPQPRAWPRPRPPYLPHPRRRLPRVRGVVRVRSKP
jgi:hypothetical protein